MSETCNGDSLYLYPGPLSDVSVVPHAQVSTVVTGRGRCRSALTQSNSNVDLTQGLCHLDHSCICEWLVNKSINHDVTKMYPYFTVGCKV